MTETAVATENCQEKLEEDAKDKQAEADAAQAKAADMQAWAAHLAAIATALKAAAPAYATARQEVKPQIEELGARLSAAKKTLECLVDAECRKALDDAWACYRDELSAVEEKADAYTHCEGEKSLPALKEVLDIAQRRRDAVQADMEAAMHEPEALRKRVADLTAKVSAIETGICARDGDHAHDYASYIVAHAALHRVYDGVDEKADPSKALACLVAELNNKLADAVNNLAAAVKKLADLQAEADKAQKSVDDMKANEGIDWLIAQAGDACRPAAPEPAVAKQSEEQPKVV